MEFWIKIRTGNRMVNLKVVRVSMNREWEIYRILGRDRSILVQSNRPFLRNVKGLKTVRPEWKLVEGSVRYQSYFEDAIRQIMEQVDK
ncbi:MAG: hypothetical protein V4725_19895 [Bacteroidota bacterium]